ncbi:MAG: ThiF family adenylyltransferase [Phycisphaeraceae bacterium]
MTERNLRQRDIIPPDRLAACRATVIGVGAIGRQVALQLAAIGVPGLKLIDPQIVETVNLAAQGYLEADMGLPKAEATARLCARLNSHIDIDPVIGRFRRSQPDLGNVIFCCVDSIETRRLIWAAVRDQVTLFVDGRMSAEAIRVLAAADEPTRRHYATTFFAGSEAFQGACTARSTIFTANIAAGLMIEQFTRHLRGIPLDADLQLNLLTSEISVTDPGN